MQIADELSPDDRATLHRVLAERATAKASLGAGEARLGPEHHLVRTLRDELRRRDQGLAVIEHMQPGLLAAHGLPAEVVAEILEVK